MANKEKNFASAIIYVYNCERRIQKFLDTIINIMEKNFDHSEIICVNDCSDDNSLNIIKQVSEKARTTSISVVNMSYFQGLELCMNAGLDLSIGDFVFEFDNTNLDFNPEVVMQIYNLSLQGYDIVSASANRKEKFTSRLFYYIFDKYADLEHSMTTESLRVLSRRVINRISSMNHKIPYRKAVYANSGLKTKNIKYEITNSLNMKSNKREKKYRQRLAITSLILFTDMGYSFAKLMTWIMMIMSILMLLYSLVVYITLNPAAGWTTIMLFLSIAFFGLFGILTIIIKYLQILVDLIFKRKNYSFESIEKITK